MKPCTSVTKRFCTGGSAPKFSLGKTESAQNLGTEKPPPLLASEGVRILANDKDRTLSLSSSFGGGGGAGAGVLKDTAERLLPTGWRTILVKTSSVRGSERKLTETTVQGIEGLVRR